MAEIGPYSNYRLTVRLELANKPGIFARVAALLQKRRPISAPLISFPPPNPEWSGT